MMLKVTPEDLGPLTVRAQIDSDGVRIELFAPGDAGREAVRSVMPELRRELTDSGFGARLELSDRNAPADSGRTDSGSAFSGRSDPGQSDPGRGGRQGNAGNPSGGVPGRNDPQPGAAGRPEAVLPTGTATILDILV
jgi:Meckel syndrome type 1 protein